MIPRGDVCKYPGREVGTRAQHGFTVVELMVAMTIALFLMGGLVAMVMHTRSTSNAQQQLAQLRENERVAMTVLTSVIQQAGYYPDPISYNDGVFAQRTLAGGLAFGAEQSLSGLNGASAGGDTVGVRFATPLADAAQILPDNVISCAGTSSQDTANIHVYSNVFQVGIGADGTRYLQCVLYDDLAGGAVGAAHPAVDLVPGVDRMEVMYGVGIAGADATGANSVTQYCGATDLDAGGVAGAICQGNWTNVVAVRVRLYFELPQYGFGGGQIDSSATSQAEAQQHQYVERVIPIMNRSGG